MNAPHSPDPAPITPVRFPSPELWLRVCSGDAAASQELRDGTVAKLTPDLLHMVGHWCRDACLSEAAGLEPGAVLTLFPAGVESAISKWDGQGKWLEFARQAVATVMWCAVEPLFVSAAREEVGKAINALPFSREMRERLASDHRDAVAGAICAAAPVGWLGRGAPVGWQAFVRARANDMLKRISESLAPEAARWELDDATEGAIRRLAAQYASNSMGWLDPLLRDELVNEALWKVWLEADKIAARGRRKGAYAYQTANNAMRALLNPQRSHNLTVIFWMIQKACDEIREREKREPEIDEIIAELDPKWIPGAGGRSKFTRSMIQKILALFVGYWGDVGPGPDLDAMREELEELAIRARLTAKEKAVVAARMEGDDHKKIATDLNIPEKRSIRVHHDAMRKLRAVAKVLTYDEWRALQLRFGEGQAHEEIAAALGIAKAAAFVLLSYAEDQLSWFPKLLARLTPLEQSALGLVRRGVSRKQAAFRLGLAEAEVAALLRAGLAKLEPRDC